MFKAIDRLLHVQHVHEPANIFTLIYPSYPWHFATLMLVMLMFKNSVKVIWKCLKSPMFSTWQARRSTTGPWARPLGPSWASKLHPLQGSGTLLCQPNTFKYTWTYQIYQMYPNIYVLMLISCKAPKQPFIPCRPKAPGQGGGRHRWGKQVRMMTTE